MQSLAMLSSTSSFCTCRSLPHQRFRTAFLQPQVGGATLCRRRSRQALRCALSTEEEQDVSTDSTASSSVPSGRIGRIAWKPDTETFQDAMAFAGPVPERTNGRIAMIGFVAAVAAELATKQSVTEQMARHPISVIFSMVILSAASIIPKYASGVSLQEITDAASREGLPPPLRFFNKTHEIWLGRVAMIGFSGLIAVETFKGGPLF